MFGKGARQIQADPTLDVSKCKCCQCDKAECKGCMQGATLGQMAGCCPSASESLIFEYERPDWSGGGEECCDNTLPCCPDSGPRRCLNPDGSSVEVGPGVDCPDGSFDPCNGCLDPNGNQIPCPSCSSVPPVVRRCCFTGKQSAPKVRFLYNYVGKYFRMDFAAAGNYKRGAEGRWPENGRPRLCTWCDTRSHDARRSGQFPGAEETCLDRFVIPRDDPGNPDTSPCFTDLEFTGCQCMGDGILADSDRYSKRLSKFRKRIMEQDNYYKWLADIMCYDNGNVVGNPWYIYDPEVGDDVSQLTNGTLYNHLIGVVHCEHWWEIARCPENPDHGQNGPLSTEVYDQNGNVIGTTGANTSCIAPRFWIYACSGVPFFDFELKDALDKRIIGQDEFDEIVRSFSDDRTPRKDLMNKLSAGGYFDTGDWRQEALAEIRDLKTRKYTASFYGGSILGDPNNGACCITEADTTQYCYNKTRVMCEASGGVFFPAQQCTSETCSNCSSFGFLGPVRKKYWADDIGIPGVTAPAFLNPKKVRPKSNILQLPSDLIKDPWDGGPYPKDPGPNGDPKKKEEYADFIAWRNAQWVYMHARPGGWDYVCAGYNQNNPTVNIPDLPRRYNNINCQNPDGTQSLNDPDAEYGGCLAGLRGWPQRTREFQGGCPTSNCGYVDQTTGEFVIAPLVGCVNISCVTPECGPKISCEEYPERGGGLDTCENVVMDANCDGIHFMYYRVSPRINSQATCNEWKPHRVVHSYLYKVNRTKGNFTEFCPYQCRNLRIPQQVANLVPRIYVNKLAHFEVCKALTNNCGNSKAPDGTYCYNIGQLSHAGPVACNEENLGSGFSTNAFGGIGCVQYDPLNSQYYFGPEYWCCAGKDSAPPATPTPGANSTHPALPPIACKLRGPGNIYGDADEIYELTGCCYDCQNQQCVGIIRETDCPHTTDPSRYKFNREIQNPQYCCGDIHYPCDQIP
jgi:hypothetical protein